MGVLHEADDLLENGVGSDLRRRHPEGAGGVHRSTDNRVAGPFRHREWLAGEHALVDR